MAELNPIIRNAVFTGLHALEAESREALLEMRRMTKAVAGLVVPETATIREV
jgi:hypothetical protein